MSEIRDDVLQGISTILWCEAWANHAEEHGCYNLSGCQIEDHAPEIPKIAHEAARRLLAYVLKKSGCTIEELWERADKACAKNPSACQREHTPERFGNCLAWEGMGAGVCWEDDHAEVPGRNHIYYRDDHDIRIHADATCKEETDRKPCEDCGYYCDPSRSLRCENCGKKYPDEWLEEA